MTLRPYPPGKGPSVDIEFAWFTAPNGTELATVFITDSDGVCRFIGKRYRPSPLGRTDREMCADVIGFALAYVERPDEFGREPDDSEQLHAAWWRQHGDAITSALLPDDDE